MHLIKSISGIRGTLGGSPGHALTPVDVVRFVAAFGSRAKRASKKKTMIVGRDARPSGATISALACATLQNMGFDVVDLGLSTTPTVALATPLEKAAGGIVITASHNPIQWNALKLFDSNGEFISSQEGKKILQLAEQNRFDFEPASRLGSYRRVEHYIETHVDMVKAYPLVDAAAIAKARFRIVVDGINSTGGVAVPLLLERLGAARVEKIYCRPDGRFAHDPEPLPQHLRALRQKVRQGRYDMGIAVDPDVDRLVFVQEDGVPFGEEYTLVAVADHVLRHRKGSVVSNLSSTQALRDVAHRAGCRYYASAVGEVNVVKKMKRVDAVIGGEGNGGVIVPDFHYGRDALIGIAMTLTHLAHTKQRLSALRRAYPSYFISKNKIKLPAGGDVDHLLEGIKQQYRNEKITASDGVKIEFKKKQEWVHLRKSNTEPIIRIYAEASSLKKAHGLTRRTIGDIEAMLN